MEIDNGYDDVLEEACVGNDYKLHSKGVLKYNDSPSTLNMVAKKTHATTISTEMYLEKVKDSRKDSTTIQFAIRMDLNQKGLGDLKLDYDVMEYLKKMKANITMFELCKIT